MAMSHSAVQIPFNNSYARLPERLFARVDPVPVDGPRLIQLNDGLARSLGIDPVALRSPEGVEVLAGSRVAEGSEPLALAYAGHQFAHFVPQLGDGRANLLGEVAGFDVQLKGSGRTPFSRGGDGRAALGPVLREYVVSEAMWALGVPTTRSLAAVLTGEAVWREQPLPGAVLTRVASSHLRVGTFQYFAARGDEDALDALAKYAASRHYPDTLRAERPALALLRAVITRHAALVAQWMMLGFVHGVMNTDNCSVAGETLDYGPCAFMESYNPGTVFSSIDAQGRYAYANQPAITLWNLTRLAESLIPLLEREHGGSQEAAIDAARAALNELHPQYESARTGGLRKKLGLHTEEAGDAELAEELLARMGRGSADFTLTFRRLADAAEDPHGDERVRLLFTEPELYDEWAARWRMRLERESTQPSERAAKMRRTNPIYIPRNHLVEELIASAVTTGNFRPFEQMLAVTAQPFVERSGLGRYAEPAQEHERVLQTFCGT
jgi:serine/tyrosine/threonine adenylyltransferase